MWTILSIGTPVLSRERNAKSFVQYLLNYSSLGCTEALSLPAPSHRRRRP